MRIKKTKNGYRKDDSDQGDWLLMLLCIVLFSILVFLRIILGR